MDNVVRKYKLSPSQVIKERANQTARGELAQLGATVEATLEFLDVLRESLQESNREAAQVILNALESSIEKMKDTVEEERGPWSS